MLKRIGCVAVMWLVLGTAALADGPEREAAAIASARAWLSLVDEGKYAQSWKDASGYFRQAVSQEQWSRRPGRCAHLWAAWSRGK